MIWLHNKIVFALLATAVAVVAESATTQQSQQPKLHFNHMDKRVKARIQKRAAQKVKRQPDALHRFAAASTNTTKYAGVYSFAGASCDEDEAYQAIVYPTQVCQPLVVEEEQYAIQYLCTADQGWGTAIYEGSNCDGVLYDFDTLLPPSLLGMCADQNDDGGYSYYEGDDDDDFIGPSAGSVAYMCTNEIPAGFENSAGSGAYFDAKCKSLYVALLNPIHECLAFADGSTSITCGKDLVEKTYSDVACSKKTGSDKISTGKCVKIDDDDDDDDDDGDDDDNFSFTAATSYTACSFDELFNVTSTSGAGSQYSTPVWSALFLSVAVWLVAIRA